MLAPLLLGLPSVRNYCLLITYGYYGCLRRVWYVET
jgi:hypothetical protein